jgi:hypothetical protein
MRQFATVLILFAALAEQARAAVPDQLRLHIDSNQRVNAVYHVACLASSIACTKDVFERLWKDRLGWTADDQTALDWWRQVMTDVTNSAPARSPAPLLLNTSRFHPGQAARQSVIVAAIESRSPQDLVRRSTGILDLPNAVRIKQAIDHFDRRIRSWWRSERRQAIQRRVKEVEQHARRAGMPGAVVQVGMFLEADLPNPDVYVHAITAPDPQSKDYMATQFGNHFVIEMVDETTTGGIVGIAMHELTHYLYDRAPPNKHLMLLEEFMRSRVPSVTGLYTYLNEAIAGAAPGLLKEEAEEEPGDESQLHPYEHPLRVAAFPLLNEAIAHRKTLFSDFVGPYMAAGTIALKEKLRQPQFVLAQVALLLPEDSGRMTETYFGAMFPKGSVQFLDEAQLDTFPDLSVVRFVRYDALGSLGDIIPSVSSLRAHRGFAYAMSRGRGARTYVLAGRDTDAIVAVIMKLASLDSLTSDGLLFTLD